MKTFTLKLDVEFDQNDAMLCYFKDMYENSYLASTLEYDKKDISNHKHGADLASNKDLQI